MSDSPTQPAFDLATLAEAARQVAEPADFTGRAQRLITLVRGWANPAAIVALVRDPTAEAGLRVLPELSAGYSAGAAGQERALARLIEEAGPERVARPWPLPPPADMAGLNLKPRDSWLVPWSVPGASGFLLLRGVPTPYPANLAEAVALVAPAVWALLPGTRLPGSLERLGAAVAEARTVLEDLQRQLASARESAAVPPPAALDDVGPDLAPAELREAREALARALAESAAQHAAAQTEREGLLAAGAATQAALVGERDELRAKLSSAEHAAESQAADLEAAHTEAARLRTQLGELETRIASAAAETDTARNELAQTQQRARELEAEAQTARTQSENARAEVVALLEQARSEAARAQASAAEALGQGEQLAHAAAQARTEAETARAELAAADVAGLRAELERLRAELTQQSTLASEQQAAAAASRAALERMQAEAGLRTEPVPASAELATLRAELQRVQEQVSAAQADAAAAHARNAELERTVTAGQALGERGQGTGPDEPSAEFERLRTELTEQLAHAREQAALAQTEAQEARSQLERARTEAPAGPELESLQAELAHAQADAEQARAAAAAAREQLEGLRERLQFFEGPVAGALSEGTAPIAPGARLLALEAAATEAVGLRERLDAAEQARAALADQLRESQERLPALEQEAQARAEELASLRNDLLAERLRAETEHQALEATRQALRSSESLLASQAGEAEAARRQRGGLQEQIELAERARASAEAERDRARAEVNPLWSTIESLQRQIKDEEQRRATLTAELSAAQGVQSAATTLQARLQTEATALHERVTALERAHEEAGQRAQEAERALRAEAERSTVGVQALRSAWEALRRTPFVPPTLRVSFAGVQELLAADGQRTSSKGLRVLLLDRDTPGLEPLAAALEAEGVDVLIAHYADEAAFFLKTPEARQLGALVGDVMAFRNELDLLERYRLWRLDHPALALLVSCRADDPVESERARRLPPALGAIQVGRPLTREAVLDGVQRASRRPAARASEPPTRPPTRR